MREQLITKSRHLALFVLLVSLLGLTVLPLYSTHDTVSSAPPLVAEPMSESTNEVTVPLAAELMNESTNELTDPLAAEPMSESTNELSEPLVQSSEHLDALSASSTTPHAPDGECYTLYLPAVLGGSGTATTTQSNSTANGAAGLDCPPPDSSGPTTIVRTSPLNGEDGVAVTRETIIEFSGPIDPATVTDSAISAQFGGQTLALQRHISPDKTRVTLFYDDILPASARVRVTIDGQALLDAQGNPIDVDGDDTAGGTTVIDFDTLTLTVIEGTSVCGRVFASELAQSNRDTSVNVPLQGVTITVDGMEETLRTTTDSKGNFCLDPAPAGRFFVHIDGRTATNGVPEGTYYPFVGKAWESTIGQQTNVGTAHLPLVPDGTLQPVSQTEDTTINLAPSVLEQFPEFADVSITVPANSLYADNGTRGGSVGIAPVPPDRLPGQLPEELNFPVVITVQTDGATNFDEPAPVCFPNLPDADTGEPLAAGEKSALFSFNHDTGRWEIAGSMTVSQDGTLICTDEGVGVRAPGWHGTQPGVEAGGGNVVGPGGPDEDDPPPPALTPTLPGSTPTPTLPGSTPTPPSPTPTPTPGYEEVEIKFRAFIPCDAIFVPGGFTFDPKLFGGDGRGFSYGNGTHRAEQLVTVTLDPQEGPIVSGPERSWGTSSRYKKHQGSGGVKKTAWCWKINPGESPEASDTLPVTEENNKVTVKRYDGADRVIVTLELEGANPVSGTPITPDLDARIKVYISQKKNQEAKYWLKGRIDGFSAYEIYINKSIVASFHPIENSQSPASLFPPMEWGINTGWRNLPDGRQSSNLELQSFEPTQNLVESDKLLHQTSEHYYALLNLNSGVVEQRGLSPNGMALPNVILAPNTPYRLLLLQPQTQWIGFFDFTTPESGNRVFFGDVVVFYSWENDLDVDDLRETAEFILGTAPDNPDTDGDGIDDGAEVQQGTNPLDGLPAATGIIASADTPGTAVDVCVTEESAVVADSEAGVSVFNVFNGMNPSIIAQVDTPGNAQAVACAGNLVAVADGEAGLAIIDITDPPAAQIIHQIGAPELVGNVQAVLTAGDTAYVGTTSGRIYSIEMSSGLVFEQVSVGQAIQDLAIEGERLVALTEGTLYTLSILDGPMQVLASVATPGNVNTPNGRMRLFAGGSVAYPVHRKGYNTIDVSNPLTPTLITASDTPQFGWKQIALNGSGLGVAAVSPNSTFDGPHHVSLYDTSDPNVTDAFLTQFETPGIARSVSIYNGLAYVADHDAGLQVINYLAYDAQGMSPTVSFSTNLAGNEVEERSRVLVDVAVDDDVQVRHVELLVDGEIVEADGNFPFQFFINAPLLTEQSQFSIAVRATDTGGNRTTTETRSFTVTPDSTPPFVIATAPISGGLTLDPTVISVRFNEPIEQATLTSNNFQLFGVGSDGIPGTADDTLVPGGTVSYNENSNTARLTFNAPLPTDRYRAVVTPPVSDLAGNALTEAFEWTLRVDILPEELVAYWSFDNGTAMDNSGYGNDGVIHGDPEVVEGPIGQAVKFNGNDYIRVNGFTFSDRTQLSVSIWVKPDEGSPQGWQEFLSKHHHAGDVEFLVRMENDLRYDIEWTIGGTFHDLSTTGPGQNDSIGLVEPTYNEFDLLTAIYDGEQIKFYVNAKQIATREATGEIASNSLPLTIGAASTNPNIFTLKGAIDEIRIYNRALNEEEIQRLYQQGN